MKAKSKWLMKKDGNIIIPKTLDTQVFDEDGKSLDRRLKTAKDKQVVQLPKVDPTLIVSDLDYSTEEQLTGRRWIDGKPIYQITITGTGNNSSGDNYKINNPINDLDVIANIDCTAKITSTVSAAAEVPNMQMSNGSILANYIQSENQFWLQQTQTSGNSVYEYKLTILYTKTTDTADSPVNMPVVDKLPFKFGIDENGNYGYIKVGADTVTPFNIGLKVITEEPINLFYGGSYDFTNNTDSTCLAKFYDSNARSSQYCMYYYGIGSANIEINAGTQHNKQIYCVIKQGEILKLWAQQNAGVFCKIAKIPNSDFFD